MPKANLTLIGASLSLTAETAKTVLVEECQLSEEELDAACEALFELKEPFILCKNVELAVAANHFGQLKALGIDCEVEVLDLQDSDDGAKTRLIRNCVLGAAGVLAVAVGTGYFFYSQKDDQSSSTVAEQQPPLPFTVKIAEEVTDFNRWQNRLNSIESLKRRLDRIPNDWFKDELIESVEDPVARTVVANYATQQAIEKHASGSQNAQIIEQRKKLEASASALDIYPTTLDQFYVTLDLAGVYHRLRQHSEAKSILTRAENFVANNVLNQPADIIIAQVALAEHQHLIGRTDSRDAHLVTATAATSGFDDGSEKLREGAIAYIALGEAKFGLFARAHGRLKTISDEKVVDSVMTDISRYAASKNNEPSFELPDLTSREYSAD